MRFLEVSSTRDAGPGFNAQALTITVDHPPLKIVGGFEATATPPISYYGKISVQVTPFGFEALGGYTPSTGSFFLYARLNAPLGGPPFLFVTGLAAGFGLNTRLVLPTFANLSSFLLLPANSPPNQPTPELTMQLVLPQFATTFVPLKGEYWIAAGLQFTSFEMIKSFALVTVSFGVDLQLALIGSCAISLPKGEPLAYVEIDLLASFTASTGLFAIMGKLSPASYVYGPFVHLGGGFAFYIWVSGTNRGNFVVSFGGYSTTYTKPAIYPAVPRLSISFGLGPFQALGQSYFALLPSMMMAGISISITWSAGPVKVWFDMGVEFMIGWAPLQYSGYAYVAIGCSLDLGLFTIKLQIGADLLLWGPAFGGKATVDLDIFKFTIGFGSSSPPAVPPLGWAGFKDSLLPADTPGASRSGRSDRSFGDSPLNSNIIKASVPDGLLHSGITGSDGQFYDWVVSPSAFGILTNSTVPANGAAWALAATAVTVIPNTVSSYNTTPVDTQNGPYLALASGEATYSKNEVWAPLLSIAPMQLVNVGSIHTIKLRAHADSDPVGQFSEVVTSVQADPQMMSVSAALWAPHTPQHDANEPSMVPFGLTGFLLQPIPRTPDSTSAVPLLELLFEEGKDTGFSYTGAEVSTVFTLNSSVKPGSFDLEMGISGAHSASFTDSTYILSTLADEWVAAQRSAILTALVSSGFATYSPAQIDLALMSTVTELNDWPSVVLLGGQ